MIKEIVCKKKIRNRKLLKQPSNRSWMMNVYKVSKLNQEEMFVIRP